MVLQATEIIGVIPNNARKCGIALFTKVSFVSLFLY
jgi:hypothetical protein